MNSIQNGFFIVRQFFIHCIFRGLLILLRCTSLFINEWFFLIKKKNSETIHYPINKEPKIDENVDEMIDVLNDFMESNNGDDDVDKGAMGST